MLLDGKKRESYICEILVQVELVKNSKQK